MTVKANAFKYFKINHFELFNECLGCIYLPTHLLKCYQNEAHDFNLSEIQSNYGASWAEINSYSSMRIF